MKCLCDICETPDCKRNGCKFPIIHDVASEKEESAPSAIHNTTQAAIAGALVRVMQELGDYLGVDFSQEIDEVQRASVR